MTTAASTRTSAAATSCCHPRREAMALLRKSEGSKPLRPRAGAPSSAVVSTLRPRQIAKASPCQTACLAGTDVRGALALLNQREKLGLTMDEACERAWRLIVETNPFPATTGRI